MAKNEITKGGSQICRYEDHKPKPVEFVGGDESLIEDIANHIEKYLGPISSVIHEIISQDVHIDIHIIPPTKDRNFYTLVTSGMSEKPMIIETDEDDIGVYAEMMIALPPEWKMTKKDMQDENNYWPIRWLYNLAHFPHAYDTYFLEGHSIPNNDPPEPLAANTDFIGFIIGFPRLVPKEFTYLEKEDKTIIFFALYPVYNDEMNYKLEEGSDKFFKLAKLKNVSELIDINRKSIVNSINILERIKKYIKERMA